MIPAVHSVPLADYAADLPRLLDALGLPAALAGVRRVVLKPNLVNASPPPVTLPVACAAAVVAYLQRTTRAEVVIAEGCGDLGLETPEIFRRHGYAQLARETGVALVDLNSAPTRRLADPACSVFPEMHLPELLFDAFVISAAVLKAHSLAGVTLGLKNMIGCAPPRHYQQGGRWKKSAFHARMHEAIVELNRYRRPDLVLIDAGAGLAEHHLGGAPCHPPPGRLLAGFDPVAVDAAGAALLGRDWRQVPHLRLADGLLGRAEPDAAPERP